MFRRFRSHLTYANVMATVAVFVALGGASYAAVKLPRNSVGGAQIRKNAVTGSKVRNSSLTGADVKNGSLTVTDFKGSMLGPAGPQGVPGPPGRPGDAGPAGRSALAPLQSGEVVRGVVGEQVNATAGEEFYVAETLPIPAPELLTNGKVIVDGPYDDPSDPCKGSFADPTAPPGKLCIYGSGSPVGTNTQEEEGTAASGAVGPASRYGFSLRFYAVANGEASVLATWAYTAP